MQNDFEWNRWGDLPPISLNMKGAKSRQKMITIDPRASGSALSYEQKPPINLNQSLFHSSGGVFVTNCCLLTNTSASLIHEDQRSGQHRSRGSRTGSHQLMSLTFISSAPSGLTSTPIRHVSASPLKTSWAGSFVSRRRTTRVHTSLSTPRMATTEPSKEPTAKELAQLYGGSYLGTSIGLSIISFGVFYFLIAVGIDIRALLNALGDWFATTPLGRPSILDTISDEAGTAALAYIAHKATSPLRFPVTIAATPLVASLFSKKKNPEDSS